ncbi:F0F1 ATP synthase subunit A [Chloroflexota bacterium]
MAKKGCLGCSFPVLIGIVLVFLAIFVIGFLSGPIGQSMFDITLPSWLSVSSPHPELPPEVVFHIFGFSVTNSILGAWLTIIVLVGFSYIVTRKPSLIPGRLQTFLEYVISSLYNFCKSVAGEENGRRFFPLVATIFLFIIVNAWLSLLPGFGSILVHTSHGEAHLLRGANTDVNVPLAVAIISFAYIEYCGFRSLGIRYMGKFLNAGQFFKGVGKLFTGKIKAGFSGMFMGFIDMFVGVLEGLSEVIRIVSFTFRLFGNMTAGEILLLVATFLIPWLFALPFYGLEILVGFLQALIFSGLTLVFLTLAVASHGHEEEKA